MAFRKMEDACSFTVAEARKTPWGSPRMRKNTSFRTSLARRQTTKVSDHSLPFLRLHLRPQVPLV